MDSLSKISKRSFFFLLKEKRKTNFSFVCIIHGGLFSKRPLRGACNVSGSIEVYCEK